VKPNREYFNYLESFGSTVPVEQLLRDDNRDIIALRHDVDHDLGIALDFAFYEYQMGLQSTYFVLHDHPYNDEKYFIDRLLQIQDYGHEIGVHLDLVTGWFHGKFDCPREHLLKWLDKLRESGVRIAGSATHGDSACYELGVLNSWYFSEDFPDQSYQPISPEGIIDPQPQRNIAAPSSQILTRADGEQLTLGQALRVDFGIDYEAVQLRARYWSDTGKDWYRTGEPNSQQLKRGRHQVLMHPIHWLGSPRKIFFLSTARVGSKWASNVISRCTSASTSHEWTLNHRQRNGKHVQEKISTQDNELLSLKPEYTFNLIDYARRYKRNEKLDSVEFNVYLSDHVETISAIEPKTEFYGLTRSPLKVIPSLLARSWYATHTSVRHPNNARYESEGLSQLEKIVRYWVETNKTVLNSAAKVFLIENVAKTPRSVADFLTALDFPAHSRLISELDFTPLDSTAEDSLPSFHKWKQNDQQYVLRQTKEVAIKLGYSNELNRTFVDSFRGLGSECANILAKVISSWTASKTDNEGKSSAKANKWTLSELVPSASAGVGVKTLNSRGMSIVLPNEKTSAWVVFSQSGQSTWSKLNIGDGFASNEADMQFDGLVKFRVDGGFLARAFYLEYDVSGAQVAKRALTQLTPGWRGRFSEKVTRSSNRFLLAIHFSAIDIEDFEIKKLNVLAIKLEVSAISKNYAFG